MPEELRCLEFGETYNTLPSPEASAKWGARMVEVSGAPYAMLWDRQGNQWSDKAAHEKLHKWIDETLLPWIKNRRWRGNMEEAYEVNEGQFHARMSTNASFGYLYVCAWADDSDDDWSVVWYPKGMGAGDAERVE